MSLGKVDPCAVPPASAVPVPQTGSLSAGFLEESSSTSIESYPGRSPGKESAGGKPRRKQAAREGRGNWPHFDSVGPGLPTAAPRLAAAERINPRVSQRLLGGSARPPKLLAV